MSYNQAVSRERRVAAIATSVSFANLLLAALVVGTMFGVWLGFNPMQLPQYVYVVQQQQAIRDVKGSLILEHVADQENIRVTDEEVDGEIEKISAETRRPKEKVTEVLTREAGLDRLKTQIRNKKTLDFLQERARIRAVAT